MRFRRRTILSGLAVSTAMPAFAASARAATASASESSRLPKSARPLPLASTRLLPSSWADAVEANRRYLMRLDPDRLLHNFLLHAGLEPRGEVYGGWEADTIAGHTLGHYMTALALMHAQTGDAECARRALYIIAELDRAQSASPDGYVAGFTRRRGEVIENGKAIFPEIMAGEIRSAGFDLNGCWVPFYNWHKLYAGLFDIQQHIGSDTALSIARKLGGYIETVFDALDDEQVQTVLDCEHGGINESFAELHVRTGEARWLALAERLRHRKVLDPLAREENSLPWLHANTQIPKVIGLARLHEITGRPGNATAARFFWDTVANDYTYVIGGNADREMFPAPNTVSQHITEQTCESCNSYNMLKLTRHIYAWRPDARLFDYYERAHTNHILAQQRPDNGMFAYMVPLMSGAFREWSEPFDSFWCCVGSGMESHSKHGESIWWEGAGDGAAGDMLLANLYIPSRAVWEARGAELVMKTGYPFDEVIGISLAGLSRPGRFTIALRVPAWCTAPSVSVNGEDWNGSVEAGYLLIERPWQQGDTIALSLPMDVRIEATPDDPGTIALLQGPLVLAADLGPTDDEFEGPDPVLVGADIPAGLAPIDTAARTYRATASARPEPLTFAPFLQQRDRRTAVYFKRFTEDGWQAEQESFLLAQAAKRELDARSVDIMRLGEMQPERDHQLESNISYPQVYRGRYGRDARFEGFFSFRMDVAPGPLILRATYWGEERDRSFEILIDDEVIATQTLVAEHPGEFFEVDYPIPEQLTQGKDAVYVRFRAAAGSDRVGPVFGVRILRPPGAST